MNESYFGKSYNHTGDINSDFLIKTRGDVVVQCNRQFVKLINGGRINVDFEFIFEVNNIDDITSGEDGIYRTEDDNVYVKIGDNIIALTSENDGDFISYVELQGVEDFKIAQQNIGLLHKDISNLDLDKLPDQGILFDNNTHKFYYIDENGSLTSLGFEMPELIKHSLKIDGGSILGSLALLGLGKSKGLSVGETIYIYADKDNSYFKSSNNINFLINADRIFTISDEGIVFTNNSKIITNEIKSINSNFKLVDENGESTLYVDNIVTKQNEVTYREIIDLIINKELIPKKKYIITDFQNEWEIQEDEFLIYKDILETNEDGEIIYLDGSNKIPSIKMFKNARRLVLTANSTSSFLPEGYYEDSSYKVQYDITPRFLEDPAFPGGSGLEVEYELDHMYKGVITKLTDAYGNSANYDFKNLRFYNFKDNKWYYTFNNKEEEYNIDNSETGLIFNTSIQLVDPIYTKQFIKYNGDVEELDSLVITNDTEGFFVDKVETIKDGKYILFNNLINNTTINNIIGDNIIDVMLEFTTFDNLEKASFEKDLKYVSFHGSINKDIFKESEYPLLYDNTKQKEVYRNGDIYNIIFIPDLIIPSGLIAMWFKEEIPDGWVICDGTNNTPNLIDKFIKGSNVAGKEGGNNEITLTIENLPTHKHEVNIEIQDNNNTEEDNTEQDDIISLTKKSKFDGSEELKPLVFSSQLDEDLGTPSEGTSNNTSGNITNVEVLPSGEGQPFKIDPEYYSMIYIMKL